MSRSPTLDVILRSGSAAWNALRKSGTAPLDHTGATMTQLFCADADLSGVSLVGTELDNCELNGIDFRNADLTNAYFHHCRIRDCRFEAAKLANASFEKLRLVRCSFVGAEGLDSLELEEADMDDVEGLEEAMLDDDEE